MRGTPPQIAEIVAGRFTQWVLAHICMNRRDLHAFCFAIEIEGALRRDGHARTAQHQAEFAPSCQPAAIAHARYVVHFLDEIAPVVVRHHHVFAAEERHVLRRQDRADEAHFRLVMIADARGVALSR